jgi:excisionase family DNA binding protein
MDKNYILTPLSLDELATAVAEKIKAQGPTESQAAPTNDEMLTVKEVAKLLGVSLVSIHAWKKDGKIKFYLYGSRIRFKKSEVLQIEKYQSKKKA